MENKKEVYNYFRLKPILLSIVLVFITLCVSIPLFAVGYYQINFYLKQASSITLYLSAALQLAVAFLVPNITSNRDAKRNHDYSENVGIEIKNNAMKIRSPLLISCLICIILGLIFEILQYFLI